MAPAGAAAPSTTSTTAPADGYGLSPAPPVAGGALSPPVTTAVLAPPGADEAARARVAAEVAQLEAGVKAAERAEKAARRVPPPLHRAFAAAQAHLEAVSARERDTLRRLDEARIRVRNLAVGSYVSSGDVVIVNGLLGSESEDLYRRRHMASTALDARRKAVGELRAATAAASAEVTAALTARDDVGTRLHMAELAVRDAADRVVAAKAVVAERRQLLDLVTAAVPVGSSDIPRLVLDAYRKAAARMAVEAPACGLRWTLIAGVGKVESGHGSYRGASFTIAGRVEPPIIGIPLDGTNGTRHISDTDGGLTDGDPVYDRAVGPMQFIPSTWAFAGRDGDGDGVRDPHNLYDAALAAGGYLCRAALAAAPTPSVTPEGVAVGSGLASPAGLHAAVFSYNRSEAYVSLVTSIAARYDALAPSLGG